MSISTRERGRLPLRTALVLAVLLASIVGVLGSTGTPAQAASYCGSACDYKDPDTYLFNGVACKGDAVTIYDGFVQLRYSPRCQTTWARAVTCCVTQIYGYSYYTSGTLRASTTGFARDKVSWGRMLNDHALYNKVCVTGNSPDDGYPWGKVCTGTY